MSSLLVFNRVYRLESGDTISHAGIFDPSNELATPLTFSLVHLPLPTHLPYVNKYSVQTDKHLPTSTFTGQFLRKEGLVSL
jgi:hypothetical protein